EPAPARQRVAEERTAAATVRGVRVVGRALEDGGDLVRRERRVARQQESRRGRDLRRRERGAARVQVVVRATVRVSMVGARASVGRQVTREGREDLLAW